MPDTPRFTTLRQLQPPSTGGAVSREETAARLLAARDSLAAQLAVAHVLLEVAGDSRTAAAMVTLQRSLTTGHMGAMMNRAAARLRTERKPS